VSPSGHARRRWARRAALVARLAREEAAQRTDRAWLARRREVHGAPRHDASEHAAPPAGRSSEPSDRSATRRRQGQHSTSNVVSESGRSSEPLSAPPGATSKSLPVASGATSDVVSGADGSQSAPEVLIPPPPYSSPSHSPYCNPPPTRPPTSSRPRLGPEAGLEAVAVPAATSRARGRPACLRVRRQRRPPAVRGARGRRGISTRGGTRLVRLVRGKGGGGYSKTPFGPFETHWTRTGDTVEGCVGRRGGGRGVGRARCGDAGRVVARRRA